MKTNFSAKNVANQSPSNIPQNYPMPAAPYYQGFMPPYYNPYYGQMMVGTNTQGFFVRKSKAKPFYPNAKGENQEKKEINSSDFVDAGTKVHKDEKKIENKEKVTPQPAVSNSGNHQKNPSSK